MTQLRAPTLVLDKPERRANHPRAGRPDKLCSHCGKVIEPGTIYHHQVWRAKIHKLFDFHLECFPKVKQPPPGT